MPEWANHRKGLVMTRLRSLSAVVCGVLAVVLLVGTTPGAGAVGTHPTRIALHDGPGDVWRFFPKTEKSVRVDPFPLADETRMVIAHRSSALVVRWWLVDIKRVGTQLYWLELKTRDHHYQAVLTDKPGHRQGQRYFQGDDGSKSCAGFTRTIDYAKDTVVMRIPRTCLGTPKWVRVGIYNQFTFKSSGTPYFDTPTSHKSPATSPTPMTPRIYSS